MNLGIIECILLLRSAFNLLFQQTCLRCLQQDLPLAQARPCITGVQKVCKSNAMSKCYALQLPHQEDTSPVSYL